MGQFPSPCGLCITHILRGIAEFPPVTSVPVTPHAAFPPARLRHSVPPGVHLPAARLVYADTVLACCARCPLSNFLSNCSSGFSLKVGPIPCFLSGRPIFHRPANSDVSSPLQNGSNPDSYGNRIGGQSAGHSTPHPGLRPAPLPRKRREGQPRARGLSSPSPRLRGRRGTRG